VTEVEARMRVWRWVVIENIATIAGMVALILGLYAMGAGGWSLWGFVLLANLNSVRREKEE
jgi:hypothetical protein